MRLDLAVLTLAIVSSAPACGRVDYDPRDASSPADTRLDAWLDPTIDAFAIDVPSDDDALAIDAAVDAGAPCMVWSHGGASSTSVAGAQAIGIDGDTVYASVQGPGIDLGGGPLGVVGSTARFDLVSGAWLGSAGGGGGLVTNRGIVYAADPVQAIARDGTYGPVLLGYDVVPSGRQVSEAAATETGTDFAWAAMPQAPYTLRGVTDPSTQEQDVAIATTASTDLYVLDAPGYQRVVDVELLEDGAVVWILESRTTLTFDGVPFSGPTQLLLWTSPDLTTTHVITTSRGETVESLGGQRIVVAERDAVVALDLAPSSGAVGFTEAWRVPTSSPNNPDLYVDPEGGVTLAWSEVARDVVHVERRIVATGALDFMRDVPSAGRPALAIATRLVGSTYAIVLAGYSFPDSDLALCGVELSPAGGMGGLFVARIQ